ncbi:transposase [Capnocytophaga gingivalis]
MPPYSPNLNLIEHLWKFLRKKVINTGFYRNKTEF